MATASTSTNSTATETPVATVEDAVDEVFAAHSPADKSQSQSDASRDAPAPMPPASIPAEKAAPVDSLPTPPDWPPKDWVDKFVPSNNADLMIVNHAQIREKVTRINNAPTLALANDPKYMISQEVAILFSALKEPPPSDPEAFRKYAQLNCIPYPVPDLPGAAKQMLMERKTFNALVKIKNHYGTMGFEFHYLPHPKLAGIYIVESMYIFKGIGINAEVEYKTKCTNCDGPAPITCMCQCVYFCSQHCREAAAVNGLHTFLDCDTLGRKTIRGDATKARQRIIAVKETLDKDENAQKQLIVRKAVEEQDAKKSAEQKRKEREDYQQLKRAKLQQSSKEALAALGMAPDPNIPETVVLPPSTLEVKHGQPTQATPMLIEAVSSAGVEVLTTVTMATDTPTETPPRHDNN